MNTLEFYRKLLALRPDDEHLGYNNLDSQILAEQHIEYAGDMIYRGVHTFYIRDGETCIRMPVRGGSIMDCSTDFRQRRFASRVLEYYEFPTPELRKNNIVRVGVRFAAYQLDTLQAVAFGDTAEDAHELYLAWRASESGWLKREHV